MPRQSLLRGAVAFILIALAGCTSVTQMTVSDIESRIVTVAQWGGTPADASRARLHHPTQITLHHQGEAFPPERNVEQYLRNLQTWSRATRNWIDIPYHYIIDLQGKIYAGRDIGFAGDTNTDYDPAGHALIEVVGNFEVAEPTQLQLDAVVEAMTMLAARYHIPVEAIHGHKDFSKQTLCPGKNLYRYLENGYFRDKVGARLKRLSRFDSLPALA